MQTKLTLRPEEALIKSAKMHARERGTSVSQLVADNFETLDKTESFQAEPLQLLEGK